MAEDHAKKLFDEAMRFYQEEDYKEAIETFKEVIYLEPQFNEALYNLACCMALTGQKDQALMYLNRACNLSFDCVEWAKEDKEFDSLRRNTVFKKIVYGAHPPADEAHPEGGEKGVTAALETAKGTLHLRLFIEAAPLTCANFINLAKRGYYDGLLFHRVIPDFMIQGGCPYGSGSGGPGYQFKDEFNPELRHNKAGILSMANAGPATNGSQFFITHKDTPWLDEKHTVFGEVFGKKDLDVVNTIQQGDEIITVKITGSITELMKKHTQKIKDWNKTLDRKFTHLK